MGVSTLAVPGVAMGGESGVNDSVRKVQQRRHRASARGGRAARALLSLSLSAREGSPEHAGGPLEQEVAAWVAARHVCDRAAVQKRNCTADHTRWKARVLS